MSWVLALGTGAQLFCRFMGQLRLDKGKQGTVFEATEGEQ